MVYGEVAQFQFDQLRDKYSQLGTLAGRECKVAIIDEVDSMLIDDSSKISRLSSTAAGLDHFQSIYTFLWQKLLLIKEKFIMLNGHMYLLNGKVFFESNGKVALEYTDEQGEIQVISDLEAYIDKNPNIDNIGQRVSGSIDKFLETTLNDYIDNLIKNKVVEIPSNFREFFKKQLPKWILHAIDAMNYQQNVHYVVQDSKIKPVDYLSTGIVQNATSWSDGLHQFLQLKHNLKMTCETFTTNFLSNIGFLKGYARIFGLTGTLGSEKAKKVLKEVYDVDLINVPQLYEKQYVEYPTIVVEEESKWIQTICSAALVETKKNRGILIICETIQQANQIGERLKVDCNVKLYTMNNMNQEKQVEKILTGEIIIATNLAGRGTDIHADAIEHTGGLHVILTFMPNNQRVEDQAFGRTARQGKRGTGQMILNLMSLVGFRNVGHNEVKHERDLIESMQLAEFQGNQLKLINAKDELFERFSKFLNEEIRVDIREKSGLLQKTKSVLKELPTKLSDLKRLKIITYITPSVYEHNMLTAIEEQWAMFLHDIDDGTIPIESATSAYDAFEATLRRDYNENRAIKNLYYHTVIGNNLIVNYSKYLNSDAAKALGHFQNASTDTNFGGSAFVGICWATIVLEKNVVKRDLLENFRKALDTLSTEMGQLNARQLLLQKIQTGFINSDLDKQLSTKSSILGSYLNSVQNCHDVIKRSLRLVDVVQEDENSIKYYYDLERENPKKEKIECVDLATYQLKFNNLTSREDGITIDQAIQNIHVAIGEIENKDNIIVSCMNKFKGFKSQFNFGYREKKEKAEEETVTKSSSSSSSYEEITLKLYQITLSRLKSLLSPNTELDDLNGKLAIAKLKEARSYLHAFGITSSYEVDVKIVHSDNRKNNMLGEINNLIRYIEANNDNIERKTSTYYLKIKEANGNDINKFYRDSYKSATAKFEIQFDGLDHTEASELLSEIATEYVNIEFRVKTRMLQSAERRNILNNRKISKRIICIDENKIYSIVENDELISSIEKRKSEEPFYIKIECDQSYAKNIFTEFTECTFNLTFNHVSYSDLMKYLNKEELDDRQVRFGFENLNKSNAIKFIQVLRKKHEDFCLEFKSLNHRQLLAIIAKAHLEQEEIQLSSVKNLIELFMKSATPHFELDEFAAKGIEYLVEINEKMFVPWMSVIAVATFGVLQLVIGGVLIAVGFGATVGMSLVAEGISDLFYAYRAYRSRQFNWMDYTQQKLVSIAISVITAGYGKLKDAGKGIATLTGEASKEVVEEGAKQVIQNGKTVADQVVNAGKNLKSLAFKYVGVKTGEAVVREGLNNGVQLLSKLSFDLIKSQVCEGIQKKVSARFCTDDLNRLMRKLHSLDALAKSRTLLGRVEKIVSDIINPERSTMNSLWDSIGVPLLKGKLEWAIMSLKPLDFSEFSHLCE